MKTAIIKYNAGNIQSVSQGLKRLGQEGVVTDDHGEIQKADKVIFPGVGQASTAMNYLRARGLDRVISNLTQPVLGICLGLQLMCASSEEDDAAGLGIFDSEVRLFPSTMKVPHMGWNTLSDLKGPLFKNFPDNSYVYFVHSYYAGITPYTNATATYSLSFSAGLERDNFFALQFHPEKSGEVGEIILKNFLNL